MPKIAFDQPLPLGMESLEEEMVLMLEKPLAPNQVQESANSQLPAGIKVTGCSWSSEKIKIRARERMELLCALRGVDEKGLQEALARFCQAETFPMTKVSKKGKRRTLDLKEVVTLKSADELFGISSNKQPTLSEDHAAKWAGALALQLSAPFSLIRLSISLRLGHLSPVSVLETLFGLDQRGVKLLRILKLPA